jgi:gliding motility-associated protein GldL
MNNYKNLMAKIYGIGAAIVIVGALFKIIHLKFANELLIVGLLTEAGIFFLSAFEKPHVDYDWSLVYPELAQAEEVKTKKAVAPKMEGTVTQQLDQMMAEAKVGPELIASLGDGLRNFGDRVAAISSAADITSSSNEFAAKLQAASKSVEGLSSSYANVSETMQAFSDSLADARNFKDEVGKLTQNLSSLNAVYGNMLSAMTINK